MKNVVKKIILSFLIVTMVTLVMVKVDKNDVLAVGNNLIQNGDFSDSTLNSPSKEGWLTYSYSPAVATPSIENGVFKWTVKTFARHYDAITLYQENIPVESNKEYNFKFDITCSKKMTFGYKSPYPEMDNITSILVRIINQKDRTTEYASAMITRKSYYGNTLEKNQTYTIECELKTGAIPAGTPCMIRIHMGGGTPEDDNGNANKTSDPPVEIILDNIELTDPTGGTSENVTLGLTTDTEAGNVVLTGGGNYMPGSKATIKAAVKEGANYVFEKWVDGSGNTLSTNPIYTLTINAHTTCKAVFKPLPQYTVDVETNNPALGNATPTKGSYNYGQTVTLTATPTDSNVFVCWEVNGKEISTSPTYQLKVTGDHKVKANFAEASKHKVTFKDASGRVLKVESVANGQAATAPTNTTKAGYIFDKWDREFNNIIEDTVVNAIYKQSPDTYLVSVTGGVIDGLGGGSSSGNYQFDDLVTVRANDTINFSYWKDTATNSIVSYDATYSFYVSGATNLTAVSNASDVQKQPIAAINNVIAGSGAVSFVAQCKAPSGTAFEIVEYGVLLSQGYNPDDIFNLSTMGIIRGSASTRTGLTGQFMITKTDAASQTWYGRAYVIYKDGGNLITVYSDVKSGVGQ